MTVRSAAAAGCVLAAVALSGSASATVFHRSCHGVPATLEASGVIDGTEGDDVILAGPGRDVIRAGGGNDLVCGGGGRDEISGGAGDDTLDGGKDGDRLDGGDGDDTLRGGAGDDVLRDDPGNDTGGGQAGEDTIVLGAGDDTLRGGGGDDTLDGQAGDDYARGDGGRDALLGGTGEDTLAGGPGGDEMLGGPGVDDCAGGPGPDACDGWTPVRGEPSPGDPDICHRDVERKYSCKDPGKWPVAYVGSFRGSASAQGVTETWSASHVIYRLDTWGERVGATYRLAGGELAWSIAGRAGDCTYSGANRFGFSPPRIGGGELALSDNRGQGPFDYLADASGGPFPKITVACPEDTESQRGDAYGNHFFWFHTTGVNRTDARSRRFRTLRATLRGSVSGRPAVNSVGEYISACDCEPVTARWSWKLRPVR